MHVSDRNSPKNINAFSISYEQFWQFNNIKRYSIRLNQTYTENDTEHSFLVAVILCRLMHKYKFESFNLLKFALIHDSGELITGDINTHCKTPELKKCLSEIEAPALDAFKDYLDVRDISYKEHCLLKAADVLTTYFYGKMNRVTDIAESGWRLFKKFLREFKNANSTTNP